MAPPPAGGGGGDGGEGGGARSAQWRLRTPEEDAAARAAAAAAAAAGGAPAVVKALTTQQQRASIHRAADEKRLRRRAGLAGRRRRLRISQTATNALAAAAAVDASPSGAVPPLVTTANSRPAVPSVALGPGAHPKLTPSPPMLSLVEASTPTQLDGLAAAALAPAVTMSLGRAGFERTAALVDDLMRLEQHLPPEQQHKLKPDWPPIPSKLARSSQEVWAWLRQDHGMTCSRHYVKRRMRQWRQQQQRKRHRTAASMSSRGLTGASSSSSVSSYEELGAEDENLPEHNKSNGDAGGSERPWMTSSASWTCRLCGVKGHAPGMECPLFRFSVAQELLAVRRVESAVGLAAAGAAGAVYHPDGHPTGPCQTSLQTIGQEWRVQAVERQPPAAARGTAEEGIPVGLGDGDGGGGLRKQFLCGHASCRRTGSWESLRQHMQRRHNSTFALPTTEPCRRAASRSLRTASDALPAACDEDWTAALTEEQVDVRVAIQQLAEDRCAVAAEPRLQGLLSPLALRCIGIAVEAFAMDRLRATKA
eukprot:SM000032S12098  [mRNA]  locus=s32:499109:501454:+ [translate_table: standard]